MRSQLGPICPRCGQRAPIVLRGLEARCTACGALRLPFSADSVTLAGQPSRIGGTVATVAGGLVLVLGLSLALFLGLLAHSIWPESLVGWAFAAPITLLSLVFGTVLLLGGKRLKKSGGEAQRSVRLDAVRALVKHRGGALTSEDVAQALQVGDEEGEALLTELARQPSEQVTLDVDDDGRIHYTFGGDDRRFRVLEEDTGLAQGELAAERSNTARGSR